ncbi:MAG TPA: AbrB/MazE/SpoVT family DNA-binding domain-containing protein [Firmicutes bacterium]|nr:AbrB/MazE/SpoVT family DNA-binding domain-containing protein [Bacillota bacterium]
MPVARIGKRGSMVLPASVRREVGVQEGDEMLIEVSERGTLHMMKKPKDFTAALRNLHKDIWEGLDPVEYVKEERTSWDK